MIEQLKSPATILAVVPFINLGIQLLLDKSFGKLTHESLKWARSNSLEELRTIANNDTMVGYLSTYIENGSNIRKFFESTILALTGAVVGYFTSRGHDPGVSDLWFILAVVIALILVVLSIRLVSEKIDYAGTHATRHIRLGALMLNIVVIVLDCYSKKP